MKAYPVAAVALATLACLAGCSSTANNQGPPCNPCDPPDGAAGAALPGHDTNPDGVPYPNPPGGYGRAARLGNRPGNVMRNFKFLGYPNADKSQGLQTIALADYYDPCGRRAAMIHVTVAGIWCPNCILETTDIVAARASLDSQRVVVLQALADGKTQGVAATPADLDFWMAYEHVNFTEVLDPGLGNFGGFFNAAAIPWNADLDPRTMEIIDEGVGRVSDVSAGLTAIPAQPGYPVPAVCGDN